MHKDHALFHLPVNIRFCSPICTPENLTYATQGSAGLDLRACIEDSSIWIEPGHSYAFPVGIAVECTMPGVAGFVYSRSGLGTKEGLVVSQGVGVIDPDYRGELLVSLTNMSREKKEVLQGQRIAQLIFQPFFQARITPVAQLSKTTRGKGGFGHSGAM